MISPRTVASWVLGCVACFFLSHGSPTAAQARQFPLAGRKISYSSTFGWTSSQFAYYDFPVQVPLFDPALGQLQAVHLEKETWSTVFVRTSNPSFFPITASIAHNSSVLPLGAGLYWNTPLSHTESTLVQIPANDGQVGGPDNVGWINRGHGYLSEVFNTPHALASFQGTTPILLNVRLYNTSSANVYPSGPALPSTAVYPLWGLPIGRIRVTYEYQ